MRVIEARNVHEALARGIHELLRFGIPRDSRNGPVLVMPGPVTTVYHKPMERVVFWPERDANPFFHLYESLWMLAGRRHVEELVRYAKNMVNYAEPNGVIHGAYGHRWRYAFGCDQLRVIIQRLQSDPNDRRSVLQMWSAKEDLDKAFKDVPCNTMATFQRSLEGELDITVFCRSNDIIWGAYGANAVQFSMLQEYVARSIGCPVGTYCQVSVNWHAYRDVLEKVKVLSHITQWGNLNNPYRNGIAPLEMPTASSILLDMSIRNLVDLADYGFVRPPADTFTRWEKTIYTVLRAHHVYKKTKDAAQAIEILQDAEQNIDWIVAAREWLQRRVK